MKQKMTTWKKTEWIWVLLVFALLLLSLWWLPGETDDERTTYSTSLSGKKAYFDLVKDLHGEDAVQRHASGPLPLDLPGTLCLLGPGRYPKDEEWERLFAWVEEGNALLFAARWDDPLVSLHPFPVRVTQEWKERDAESPEEEADEQEDLDDEENEVPSSDSSEPTGSEPDPDSDSDPDSNSASPFDPVEVRTHLVPGKVEWRGSSFLIDDSESSKDLVWEPDGSVQALVVKIGRGTLVVANSDSIFTNYATVEGDTSLLAYRLLEATSPTLPIVFDETLNREGSRLVGIFLTSAIRPFTLQCILLAVVFAWWGSRPFGKRKESEERARRSIAEHAIALGNLYYKTGSGARCLQIYLDSLRRTKTLRQKGKTLDEDTARELSLRSGVPAKEIEDLLRTATASTKRPRVSAAEVGSIVRSLAKLKTPSRD